MRSGWEGRVRLHLQAKCHLTLLIETETLVWYRNQDIGKDAICSKTLWQIYVAKNWFRTVWQNFVLKLYGRTVLQNCVAKLCSGTVWRNSASVAELCGGSYYRRVCGVRGSQPASNLLLSTMPFLLFLFFSFFFLLFPLFRMWRL